MLIERGTLSYSREQVLPFTGSSRSPMGIFKCSRSSPSGANASFMQSSDPARMSDPAHVNAACQRCWVTFEHSTITAGQWLQWQQRLQASCSQLSASVQGNTHAILLLDQTGRARTACFHTKACTRNVLTSTCTQSHQQPPALGHLRQNMIAHWQAFRFSACHR